MVKSSYEFLEGREEADFNWEGIWRIKAPSKVLFFMWTALKDRIATLDFLKNKGMLLPNMCPLCFGDTESAVHILLHCLFVWEVWSSILFKANVMWVPPVCCLCFFFHQWYPPFNCRKSMVLWLLFLPAVWWSTWIERNSYIFENYGEPSYKVLKRVKDRCFLWVANCKEREMVCCRYKVELG